MLNSLGRHEADVKNKDGKISPSAGMKSERMLQRYRPSLMDHNIPQVVVRTILNGGCGCRFDHRNVFTLSQNLCTVV